MLIFALAAAFAQAPADAAPDAMDAPAEVEGALEILGSVPPDGPGADEESENMAAVRAFEASLTYQTGDVVLGDGKAVLHVPETFGYLDPQETDRVLQAWGNPASPGTWGMLVPAGGAVLAPETWAVVVTYKDDGHVDDEDAADIDYDDVLADMRDSTKEENDARQAAGYAPVNIVGWAEPPHYDPATHKIYWAKELAFGGEGTTLNYAVRALGREGVLEFNAVATMDQLAIIKEPMELIQAFAEFQPGNRYEDFNDETDRTASYGLAALVAGGVAAKSGLFKGLIAALIAGKKFVILGIAGLGVFLKKVLSKKEPPPYTPT